jgi:hypothetical protein
MLIAASRTSPRGTGWRVAPATPTRSLPWIATLLAIPLSARSVAAQESDGGDVSDADGDLPSARVGIFISEAMQMRMPKVDQVPDTFSNVVGGGALVRLRWVEFSPQAHLIYSFTEVKVQEGAISRATNASGGGFDLGLRIAVGAFEKPGNQWYAFAYPQFSSWHLEGNFGDGQMFEAKVVEFATDFGAGYTLPVTRRLSIDIFAAFVHLGFRPQENQIVSATSYPTFGVNVTWLGGKGPHARH